MVVQYEVVVIHDLDDFGYPKFEETSNWICNPHWAVSARDMSNQPQILAIVVINYKVKNQK